MIASEKQGIRMLLCFSCSAKESARIVSNAFIYYSSEQKISKQIIKYKRSITVKTNDTNILSYQK